jgi:hypothetical protein
MTDQFEKPAAILRDATGAIVGTGAAAMSGAAIAEAERRSTAAMRAVDDAVAEQRYADAYKAGQG